jgi:hypothetical protein
MAENVILEDVEKDGEVLLLTGGRRLSVSPADATVTSVWMPEAPLTLRKGKGVAFNLVITNQETGETIAARVKR